MNVNQNDLTAHAEELLKTYRQRERKIAVLRFELAHFTKIPDKEHLEAAAFARGDGVHATGHISNKTLHIALNYREQAARMNADAILEINEELGKLTREQERLLYYVSLLDERQAQVIRLHYFDGMSKEAVAKKLELAPRTIHDIRSQAIAALAEMYGYTAVLK